MAEPPERDAEVPRLAADLGVNGLVDVHTHFLPERMLAKVRGWFDAQRGPGGEPSWPLVYREDEDARLEHLDALGLRAFTALAYPHKPGMAAWLNGYTLALAERVPACVPSATFFPEPGADGDVAEALEAGARVFKMHLEVGQYDPRDSHLEPVWQRLERAGVPIVAHVASGPVPGPFTGPGPIAEVLAAHPDLVLVVAHMGMPEYEDFLDLALRHPNVHLDTTMAFTDFSEARWRFPRNRLETLAAHAERIVLGTDFPNIPHTYAHQLAALVNLDLGDDWLRAVCHDNGARLLGLDEIRGVAS
jgi:hypothetical protein